MDLFGDEEETEEEKKAKEDMKKKAEEAKKAGGKPKVIAKSLLIFDVKPWEMETDLDALAKEILKIEKDGLFWKTEYKKEPIAFGVHKLVIGCVVEDEKISVDDL
jgi:elongation factor 1-beta